jgi:GNAT superfamily N-acetyltransferase
MIISNKISIRFITEWNSLSHSQKRGCLEMTLNDGYMKPWVDKVNPMILKSYIHGPGFNGNLAGWAAINKFDGSVMLYVRRQFRGKGVGSKLMSAAISISKSLGINLKVYPWDYKSDSFFDKHKFTMNTITNGNVENIESLLFA